MCTFSMVVDHFEPLIPWITPQVDPTRPHVPTETVPRRAEQPFPHNPFVAPAFPWTPALPIAELRQLINEFREAVAAAKTVDKLTGQADCVDPEKAKLEERVAELEKVVAKLTKKPRGRK